jgi:hypothetical protein
MGHLCLCDERHRNFICFKHNSSTITTLTCYFSYAFLWLTIPFIQLPSPETWYFISSPLLSISNQSLNPVHSTHLTPPTSFASPLTSSYSLVTILSSISASDSLLYLQSHLSPILCHRGNPFHFSHASLHEAMAPLYCWTISKFLVRACKAI